MFQMRSWRRCRAIYLKILTNTCSGSRQNDRSFCRYLIFRRVAESYDQWHKLAVELEANLEDTKLITSESVLIELLNFFAKFPPQMREATANIADRCLQNIEIETIRHSPSD